MLDSVRSRLALWHTGVLAAILIAFAVATELWLERAISRREDRFLETSASAMHANIVAEREEVPLDTAVLQSLTELRLRNVTYFVLDSAGALMGRTASRADSSARGRRREDGRRRRDAAFAEKVVLRARASAGERFSDIHRGDDLHRMLMAPVTVGGERLTIIAAESLGDQQELLEDTRAGFLIAIPLALLLAWVGGYLLARRSLAPVSAMTARAAEIGATSLNERLPVGNQRDELGHLAMVFNDLLSRLDAAFDQQRRFMADASHELRTPVSIMRGEADVALSQPVRTSEEYRSALEVVRAEGRRLSRIVSELFLLARADAGQQPLHARALYLDELVTDCVRAVRSLALGRNVTVRCTMDPPVADTSDLPGGSPESLEHGYLGDEELLRRLLVNLLDNAIKHTARGSSVDVYLTSDAREHRLRVVDRGPGIPVESQPRVFERFFRVDEAHARDDDSETGGAGLGLAIARWVAEAHGGSLLLLTARAGETTFEARLPRTSTPTPVGAPA